MDLSNSRLDESGDMSSLYEDNRRKESGEMSDSVLR